MAMLGLDAEADAAMARREFAAAVVVLTQACDADPQNIERWLKLAAAHRAAADPRSALEAVNHALAVDPLAFMTLLVKAGILESLGRSSEAGEFYGAALYHAPSSDQVPDMLRVQLDRARIKYANHQQSDEKRLAAAMGPSERDATAAERVRLARFRSNALRITSVYHSTPTHFHYPGLVEREFHERQLFPWIERLEAATADITAEYRALMAARAAAVGPYIQYAPDAPVRQWRDLNYSNQWSAAHLLESGRLIDVNAAQCPKTMAALADIHQPEIPGRSPNAMFSILAPGARIPPHFGVSNARLVCHLPLIVPLGCWFRVGAEKRNWQAGEVLIFDDTIEHEAANDGCETRVVMIFDVWHPGLSEREREAVSILISQIQSNEGSASKVPL